MSVDKDLFMYDLAAVALVHNEAPYIKEWLDYHFLAGVSHFLIYDNESTDNLQEVLKPYVDKKLVTVIPYPKKNRQLEAYNDAIRYFKFYCRYMAFIDVDEFIFPQDGKNIVEVVDEILNADEHAAGIAVNLRTFGSNGLETADYETGVLERFTRRAEDNWAPLEDEIYSGNAAVKTIANPRRIKLFSNSPHTPKYFEESYGVNENGKHVDGTFNFPVTCKKIVVNYYAVKSREEYLQKIHRRETVDLAKRNEVVGFEANDKNEILDEEILSYRENLFTEQIPTGGDFFKILSGRKRINGGKMLQALTETLLPDTVKSNPKNFFAKPKNRTDYFSDLVKFYKKAPPTFFDSKVATYLTALAASSYLKRAYLDETTGKLFEEAAFNALCQTFLTNIPLNDMRLLISELPRLLAMPYATVRTLNEVFRSALPRFMEDFRLKNEWENFEEFNYLTRMLVTFAAIGR